MIRMLKVFAELLTWLAVFITVNAWFYFNKETEEALWEPPPQVLTLPLSFLLL